VYLWRDGDDLVILLAAGTKVRQNRDIHAIFKGPGRFGASTFRRNVMPVVEHDASAYLKTPEDIAAYLNAVIEEMEDDPRILMLALRNVARAKGGVSELAREADLDRVSLSRALSGRRMPRLDTLTKLTSACGVKLMFSA
jgi:probable addiction module antidote protein